MQVGSGSPDLPRFQDPASLLSLRPRTRHLQVASSGVAAPSQQQAAELGLHPVRMSSVAEELEAWDMMRGSTRTKTINRDSHGSLYCYNRGCRCPACRAAYDNNRPYLKGLPGLSSKDEAPTK